MGVDGHGECPDLDSPELMRSAWAAMQALIETRSLKAGHDRSDGGLIVTLCEMAFAGGLGFEVNKCLHGVFARRVCTACLHGVFARRQSILFHRGDPTANLNQRRLYITTVDCASGRLGRDGHGPG